MSVVLAEGTVIAAARLCVHTHLQNVSEFHLYPTDCECDLIVDQRNTGPPRRRGYCSWARFLDLSVVVDCPARLAQQFGDLAIA